MKTRFLLLLLCGATVAGCSSGRTAQQGGSTPDGSAIILQGTDLSPGTLLESLRTRVPAMTVSVQQGECPRILFRGVRSLRNAGNPGVYVDGTRMLDTCVLTQIFASDIDTIEVYPSGNTSRPGIGRNANGLILVFRRRA
jgi:hypothetical protein